MPWETDAAMSVPDKPGRLDEVDPTHEVFRDLMGYRVREVLLVSSRYDSYILEEDGQLSESLDAEFYQLNFLTSPRITQVFTAEEALDLPIVVLADNHFEAHRIKESNPHGGGCTVAFEAHSESYC
jgi:hypothetical protein